MRKDEFLEQLVYLLQDIPDGDREEAIQYYRDYLEEAGSENEEKTIEEFGSPERVAAIIRADLAGNLNDGGSFTEKGYEDERFRDPNYQIAKRLDLPEAAEQADREQANTGRSGRYDGTIYQESGSGEQEYRDGIHRDAEYRDTEYRNTEYQNGPYRDTGYREGTYQESYADGSTAADTVYSEAYTKKYRKPWTNRILKWLLWFILICVAAPVILGAGGTVAGVITGALLIFVGIFAVVFVLTLGMIITGVITGSLGFMLIGTNLMDFLMMMGLSMVSFGCGILGILLSWALIGCFLPFLWKSAVKLFHFLSGKRKGGKRNE